jgi:hypothetical protein
MLDGWVAVVDDRIRQHGHGIPQALRPPAQRDPGVEDGLRLGAPRLGRHRGFELVRHRQVVQVMRQRGEQAGKLADGSKRGFGGKLVMDRDGGCDVLTGRARKSPKVAVIAVTRHQLMDPAASFGGLLTRSAITRQASAVGSMC